MLKTIPYISRRVLVDQTRGVRLDLPHHPVGQVFVWGEIRELIKLRIYTQMVVRRYPEILVIQARGDGLLELAVPTSAWVPEEIHHQQYSRTRTNVFWVYPTLHIL